MILRAPNLNLRLTGNRMAVRISVSIELVVAYCVLLNKTENNNYLKAVCVQINGIVRPTRSN